MSKSTSPWVYVGCGCALLAVGMVTAIGACGMMGWREIRDLEATMKDPVVREQKVLEMLGTDALPDGLYAQFYLRIPFLLDVAMVSDIASDAGFEEGHRPFTFDQQMVSVLDVRDLGGHRAQFRSNLEDERLATDALEDVDVDLGFRAREVLGRGELAFDGWTYVHQRVRGQSSGPGSRREGVGVLGEIRCDDDDGRLRILSWFRADEASEDSASPEEGANQRLAELGSPENEDDIQRLFRAFAPCTKH